AGAEANVPRARRDRGEQHERLEARLGKEAVADPDRIDDARGVGLLGDGEQLVDGRRAEQDAAIGQAQAVAWSHRPTPCPHPPASASRSILPFALFGTAST